ncbi:PucR family transcriptional regulator [Nocardia sp. NPDC004860]|uniref:PucR family transcriptional regulator n=1 Tax=Nocardia sp. NPDC004860 TaxID=3154557 RepID=UPI0033A42DE7
MALTVRRLTHQRDLGLSLVAGHENADRMIDWAHSIELADPSPWLSGGELVMTTGMRIGVTAEEQFDYVSRLVQAGCVALALDTGTTVARMPDGIRQAGDTLGLPVLAVPPTTPFVAITRAVIQELTADQVRAVKRVVDQQEMLVRAALRSGIQGVVSTLGHTLSSAVAVLDNDNRVLAVHGADAAARVIAHAQALNAVERSGPNRGRRASKVLVDDYGHYTAQSLPAVHGIYGYLCIGTDQPLSSADRLLATHAVSLISIEMGKPADVMDTEQRLRAAVTRSLLELGSSLDPSTLRYFGFDGDSRVVAFVVTGIGPWSAAERRITMLLNNHGISFLMAPRDKGLVIIVSEDRALDLRQNVLQRLVKQLDHPVHGGVGLPVPVLDATASVGQAAAAAARSHTALHGHMIDFAELGTFSVLLGSQSREQLEVLESALAPLDAYDATHAGTTTLSTTLVAYLEHNGQIEGAADAIGVHRHTLRNRLGKISELLARDLNQAHVRAELLIALSARELRRTMR